MLGPRRGSGWLVAAAGVAIAWALGATAARGEVAGKVDFARDVQPILSDKCYHCHGPDAEARKGDLRLDVLDGKLGPFAERDGYFVVSPGKVDDSVLVMRVTSDDPETLMPPPKSHRTLTEAQKQTLVKWVEQGAKWGKHWAFEVPVRPGVPVLKTKGWAKNPIDAFVLAKLEKEGLAPSPEASRESLIRRVTLDLTGLPPTPADVDGFLKDTSPDAYEKVVDRLLASPRYGERMVWEWLDAARYADTNGYQADPTRTMWPWRDWVVRAMNENMPFDQFAVWQIAGDLLANGEKWEGRAPQAAKLNEEDLKRDQRLASAFNRNHPFNGEGGRIPEETRVEDVMDRTDTVGTTFLGLTIGCAKCHDHKYDPISQKEYYSLSAYFNQCSETGEFQYVNGGNVLPVMDVATAEESAKSKTLKKAWDDAQAKLKAATPGIDAKQREWEKSALAGKGWEVVRPAAAWSAGGASMQVIDADDSVLVSGKSPDNDVHEVILRTDLPQVTGLRLDVLPDVSLPHGGPGRSPDSGNFVLTDIEVVAVSITDPAKSEKGSFAFGEATYNQDALTAAAAVDGDPKGTGWAVYKAPDKNNLTAVFALAKPLGFSGGTELRLRFKYDWQNNKQHTMGRFRLAVTGGPAMLPGTLAAVGTPEEKRSKEQKKLVRDYFRANVSKEYKPLADAAEAARKASKEFDATITKVMVMDDAKPRETHVLVKGAYDKPEVKVDPGVPAVLNPLPKAEKNDRLALAEWVVDPANPLTARVIVNRYWQQFFGVGIVKTVEDFGVQGERPVNPELLDWLAVEFRVSGWDVKHMHRLIVTSAAYRQSSKVTPDLAERDPENRLLARGPRFRLPSVILRDQALAASGLLVEKLGGPPVKPYQPPGIWEEATFGYIKYEQDHGDSLYRRGLYTFWRRIVGPTEFFDAGSRSVCTVKQSRTNTPLHALTTLNDPTFVEAARALAQRVIETGGAKPKERVTAAYRLVLAREPSAREMKVWLAALDRLRSQYAGNPAEAKKLLAVGESKRDEKIDPIEHAAYTGVCLAILNLDETLTKE